MNLMKANVIANCAVVVALAVGIAVPLVVWSNARAETQAKNEPLRRQKVAIEEILKANADQKKDIATGNTAALTDEQLKELLRLRAEATALRRESGNLGQPHAGTELTAEEQALRTEELSRELLDAAR